MLRYAWAMVILAILSECGTNVFAAESPMPLADDSPHARHFKSFLAERPRVASILWRRHLYPNAQNPAKDSGIPKEAALPQLLHSRWDNDRLFYSQVFEKRSDIDGTCTRCMYQGRSNALGFMIVGGKLTQQVLEGLSEDAISITPGKVIMDEALNLGVRALLPGTVKWTGNAFEAQGARGPIYGTLELENGVPKRLLLSGNSPPHYRLGMKYSVEYEYKRPVVDGMLPSSFTSYKHEPEHSRTAMVKVDTFELTLSDRALDVSLFSPYRFIIPRSDTVFTYTNNAIWYRPEGATNQLAQVLRSTVLPDRTEPVKKVFFGTVIALILIPALWLGWNRHRKGAE